MFANLATKRKIEEATTAQDDVTPVYVLDEIWNIVNSAGTDMNGMLEFTNKRLQNKSPTVKTKALRMVKFVCGKGASDFKRGFAKNAGSVRELLHYRGEPDPFKGDIPNQKVREAAKEALDAVFAPTDTTHHVAQTQPAYQARIQGFGSNADTGPATSSLGPSAAATANNANWGANSGTSSNASKMVGFGNPRFPDASSKAPAGKAQAMAQGVLNSKNWATAASMTANAASTLASKGQAALNLKSIHALMKDEDKTGYSSDEGSYQPAGASASNGRTFGAPTHTYSTPAAPAAEGEEARLVDSICTPGGLRAQPDKADVQTFVESLGGLNADTLVALLLAKVEGGPWQATLRAICALEGIIQLGHTEVCGKIAVAFQTEPEALQKAAASPLATLRQKAVTVLGLLGIEAPQSAFANKQRATASLAAAPAPAAAAAPVPDLMGGFDEEPAAATPSGAAMLGDLLGGETSQPSTSTEGVPPAPAQASQPPDMFQGLSSPSSTPQAQGAGASLFTGLVTSSAPQAAQDPFAAAPLQSTPAAPASHPQIDLMGGMVATASNGVVPNAPASVFSAPTHSQPSGSAGDMFGGMSLGGRPEARAAPSANGQTAASAADDALAGLFTGLSTDAHGSQAGIPGLVKGLSGGGSGGSGTFSHAMGPGMNRMGSSPAPSGRPANTALSGSLSGRQTGNSLPTHHGSVPYSLDQLPPHAANGPQPSFGMQPGFPQLQQGMQQQSMGMGMGTQPGSGMGMQPGLGMQQPGMGALPGLPAQQHQQWAQHPHMQHQAQQMAMMQQQAQLQQMQMLQQQQQPHFQQQQLLQQRQQMGGQMFPGQQQLPFGAGMGFDNLPGSSSSALPLETFQGSGSLRAKSPALGVASSKDFDFVGEHLSTLRPK